MKKRFFIFYVCLFFILILLCSCASSKVARPVYITDEKCISLFDLAGVGEPVDCYQLMTGSFEGYGDFSAEVLLKADFNQIALVAMTITGQTILEINYDGKNIFFESPFIPAGSFRGEYILADIQLAFYSVKEIEAKLVEKGLEFRYGNDENGSYREILDCGTVIWKSVSNGSHVSVNNYLRKYNYEMEMLK